MSGTLEIQHVVQAYGARRVLDDISFSLADGGIACLLGESGCGKTTMLRCIAGFENIAGGEICIDGNVVSRAGYSTPPETRRIGMVFQDYALFPHLTVARNIAFGLHGAAGHTEATRKARVHELLEIVGLDGVAQRYPHELSGGQQQRVALARALAPRPALMLLDEPFSNLDVEMRPKVIAEMLADSQETTSEREHVADDPQAIEF